MTHFRCYVGDAEEIFDSRDLPGILIKGDVVNFTYNVKLEGKYGAAGELRIPISIELVGK